uniref:1-acylglycerol-3-phosphate O-acyltransferase 9, like n=1 Tax=Myripristis murdjan TaxID=586833 RepID=A0A667Z4E8_9TELE
MQDYWALALWGLKIWLYLIVAFIMVPAMFGFSLGISETYMTILVKTLEWATLKIQKANAEDRAVKASASNGLIQRDHGSMEKELEELRRSRPKPTVGGDFTLSDCFYFCRRGIESIVEDEVTQRFTSEELVSWNLLTRTNNDFQYISMKLTLVYGLGVFVRYCILAPLRITLACIGLSWLVIGTSAVGLLPNSRIKFWLSEWVHVMCYRICARGLSATIHYHNRENKPKKGGICVANHTSPIDIVILCNDGCYAMVGQVHGGLMGVLQRAMVRSCPHVWFERAEMKDRHLVTKRSVFHSRASAHASLYVNLIFPYSDFFSYSKYSMINYLLRMMTSWALVCNVWYLPAMHQQEGEDAVQFANRVKSAIAHQGGLLDLQWDGGLKRAKVKDSFKEQQQKQYSSMVVGDDASSSD